MFHAVICFYRVEAYDLTLAQPSFSAFPPREDVCGQSCLHKSSVRVHREAKLQSAFSLGSRKFLCYRCVFLCYRCVLQWLFFFFANIVSTHPRCSVVPTSHSNYLFLCIHFPCQICFPRLKWNPRIVKYYEESPF